MVAETKKVKIGRFCSYCLHEWEQFVTAEEIKKTLDHESIGECPKCKMPT